MDASLAASGAIAAINIAYETQLGRAVGSEHVKQYIKAKRDN